MKFTQVFLILTIIIVDITYGISITNNEEKGSLSNLQIDKTFKLSTGAIHASGWLKFIKSQREQTGKNLGFVKNKFFEEQFKGDESVDLSTVDSVIL